MIGLLYVCICREKIRFVEVKWHGSLISNACICTMHADCFFFFYWIRDWPERFWTVGGSVASQDIRTTETRIHSKAADSTYSSMQIRQSLATPYWGSKTDWQHILGVRLTASSHTRRKTIIWLYRIILFYFIFIAKSSQLFFFLCSLN